MELEEGKYYVCLMDDAKAYGLTKYKHYQAVNCKAVVGLTVLNDQGTPLSFNGFRNGFQAVDDDKLTERLKHALGMDSWDGKGSVYHAYCNSSLYFEEEADWEQLVLLGLALKNVYGNDHVYSVTRDGMQRVADSTGVLIRYTVECVPSELKKV